MTLSSPRTRICACKVQAVFFSNWATDSGSMPLTSVTSVTCDWKTALTQGIAAGLTFDQLVCACIIAGTDYSTGIFNFGLQRAGKLLKQHELNYEVKTSYFKDILFCDAVVISYQQLLRLRAIKHISACRCIFIVTFSCLKETILDVYRM